MLQNVDYQICENDKVKMFKSEDYNYFFRKTDGYFCRFGRTLGEDPQWCPHGIELCDIELTSTISKEEAEKYNNNENIIITEGKCKSPGCANLCYKLNSNGSYLGHMSLVGFKKILDKLPKTVCQIPFGVISPIEAHPQVWEIFEETRKRNIVPNVTINQKLTNKIASQLAKLCGAVAISVNSDNRKIAYDAVKLLSQDYKMSQINIHFVLSQESIQDALQTIKDMKNDSRLSNLNAIVFLTFKDKNNTKLFHSISFQGFKQIIEYCEQSNIRYGMDSCACNMYLDYIKDKPNYEYLQQFCDPCESTCASAYLNLSAQFFPCSFLEKIGEWKDGIDLYQCKDFMEIWNSDRVKEYRQRLLNNNRNCLYYKV